MKILTRRRGRPPRLRRWPSPRRPPPRCPPGAANTDTGHVYWADASLTRPTGTVGRATIDGTKVNQGFITGLISAFGVALDHTASP